MNDRERLTKLVRAENYLKRTKAGYSPSGPWWRRGMPLLWDVRQSFPTGNEDGLALSVAHGLLKQTEKGYDPRAPRWKEAMRLIDQVEASLDRQPIPYLGPLIPGGKSLLLHSLTHNTDGLRDKPWNVHNSFYPAVDFGWEAGVEILAWETLEVTRQSSAMGADACYLAGDSQLLYWLGHIVRAPATGTIFRRGQVIARIAAIPGADHGHLGIDAIGLIGKDLLWGRNGNGPDYTFGAPTIGKQFAAALAV